jgi:hypothetical protein
VNFSALSNGQANRLVLPGFATAKRKNRGALLIAQKAEHDNEHEHDRGRRGNREANALAPFLYRQLTLATDKCSEVAVAMVKIRHVSVPMHHWLVTVPM